MISKESDSITMLTATNPQAMSLRRLDMETGEGSRTVLSLLGEADASCGGRCTPQELALLSKLTYGAFNHRSVESLVLALKEGLARTDNEGRIYDKLTWPKVHLWLQAHEAKILALAQDEHARSVVKNDNVGADYMDRQEHNAGAKDRLIEQLKRKLDATKKAE